MSVYTREYRLLSSDTDMYRRLRYSRLFTLLQEVSIVHATELGAGRDKTLDRGLLWIVTLQQATVTRMPEYDEFIRIETWPGKTMHLLFPRYYRITDEAGNVLIEASALWALMDQSTRKVAFPEQHGIVVEGTTNGNTIPMPSAPRMPKAEETAPFTVPYSYVDLNGHMNNTRYFDLAEDTMPPALRMRAVRKIQTEYSREVKLGETFDVRCEQNGDAFLVAGECAGQKLFRLCLTFAPEEA